MVRVPAGEFLMGAAIGEKESNDNERPQRKISVPEFWIGKYVITQAQWKALMGPKTITTENPTPSMSQGTSQSTSYSASRVKKPLQPIENIFWTDAVEFCQRLSQHTGRDYRLPSGAQWEYACRAGSTTPFHFGETLTPDLAIYIGSYTYAQGPRGIYREQTTEVGLFPPNAFGLYDMHGNVWEWCLDGWPSLTDNLSTDISADIYTGNHSYHDNSYRNNRQINNLQKLSGQKKSLRGGSWFYLPTNCRSAYRLTYPFHNRTDDIGFHVVCQSPEGKHL